MCAKLALLWHMHQPCYLEPTAGRYVMPWVFLHGTKDYREMLDLALERNAKVTFNFVPALLDQLEAYGKPGVPDNFLILLAKDPDQLNPDERNALSIQLSMLNPEKQGKRYSRLHDLTQRLLRAHRAGEGERSLYSRAEWLDLEVLYLLAWTGEATRTGSPLLSEMARRGEGFSQEEKLLILAELQKVCADTPAAFRKAFEENRIELSATPYCHPILPLLLNIESARVAVPGITLPPVPKGVFGSDAETQVKESIVRHEKVFGRVPDGFWPSEGSVSPETLALLIRNGVKWAATDEDILAASLGRSLSGQGRGELYRPYSYQTTEGGMRLFFRDKALSDLIGFVYSSWPAKAAANDFVAKLSAIARTHGPDAVITVVLDGENAWEHYDENGAPFLKELYTAVNLSGDIQFATFNELCGQPAPTLSHIHSGSWIYGSFTTWVGHEEKNRAWELLAQTRERVGERWEILDGDARKKVWDHLRVAEGSDWFWWLGDDHYTPLAGKFDELFRSRLMAVYREMGEGVPSNLRQPIKRIGRRGLVAEPLDWIRPAIDGHADSFFGWHHAGVFDLCFDSGSMHRTDSAFGDIQFGTDGGELFLCIRTASLIDLLKGEHSLEVVEGADENRLFAVGGGAPPPPDGCRAFLGEVLEMAIPFSYLKRDAENRISLAFRLVNGKKLVERAPLFHMAEFVPEADKNKGGWSV